MALVAVDRAATRYGDIKGKPDKVKEAVMLLETAEGHLDDVLDPDTTRALKAAKQASEIFTELKHSVGTADANRMVVKATNAQGDKEDAEKLAKKGISDFKAKSHQRGQAIMTLALAEVGLNANDAQAIGNEEAAINAKEAADSLHKLGDDATMEAYANITLAKAQMARRLPKEAIEAANSAIELAGSANDSLVGAKALQALGEANILNEQVGQVKNGMKNGVQAFKNAIAIFADLGANVLHAYALYDTARATMKCLHKPKQVLQMAYDSYGMFKEAKKTKAALACLEFVVQASIKYDYVADANKAAFSGVMFFKNLDANSKEVAGAWMLVTECHIAEHNPLTIQNGLDALTNCFPIAEETKDQALKLKILQTKAKAQCEAHLFADAAETCTEARNLAKELDDSRQEAAVLEVLINVGIASDEMETAAQAAEEQREVYQKLGMKSEESGSLLMAAKCLGDKTRDSSQIERGLSRAREARSVAQEAKDAKAEGAALLLSAKLFTALEKEDDAVEAATTCVKILKKAAQADVALGGAYSYLARNFMTLGMPTEALKNADEASSCAKSSQDPKFEAETFIMLAEVNYGVAVRQDQDTKSGLQTFHKCVTKSWQSAKLAKARCERWGYKDLLPKALCAMGEVGVIFDTELATKSAQEAQNLSAAQEDDVGVATAVLCQANILYHKGRNADAKGMAERGWGLAAEAGLSDLMADAGDLIGRCSVAAPEAWWEEAPQHEDPGAQMAMPDQGAQSVAVPAKAGLDLAMVIETITRVATQSVASDEEIDMDTPLMDAGLDSLSSVAFRNTLIGELKMQMPAALMFDYPNVRLIADWIVEKSME